MVKKVETFEIPKGIGILKEENKTLELENKKIDETISMEAIDNFVILYRAVGELEYRLVKNSAFRSFPMRMSYQDIFFCAVNEENAINIAKDWNARDRENGNVGYVLKFNIRKEFIEKYELRKTNEYYIPAKDFEELNRNLIGYIEGIYEFRSLL